MGEQQRLNGASLRAAITAASGLWWYMGKVLYDDLGMPADACAGCEECMARCPAGIDIPERMKEVVAGFGARKPLEQPQKLVDS